MSPSRSFLVGVLIGALTCLPFAPWLQTTASASPQSNGSGVPSFADSNLRYPATPAGLDQVIYHSLSLADALGFASFPGLGTPVSEQDVVVGQLDSLTTSQRLDVGDTLRGTLHYAGVDHPLQLYVASEFLIDDLSSTDPEEQATLDSNGAQVRYIAALADSTGSQAVPSLFKLVESNSGNVMIPVFTPSMQQTTLFVVGSAIRLAEETGDLLDADLRLLSLADRGMPVNEYMLQTDTGAALLNGGSRAVLPSGPSNGSKNCACDCNNDGITEPFDIDAYNELCRLREIAHENLRFDVDNATTIVNACLKAATQSMLALIAAMALCSRLFPIAMPACVTAALKASTGVFTVLSGCLGVYKAALLLAQNAYENAINTMCMNACFDAGHGYTP